jgi:hypothetical protein
MSGTERPGEPDGPADAEAEAVWNDLVAAFHESQAPEDGPAPWPEAENVTQPRRPRARWSPGPGSCARPPAQPRRAPWTPS